MIRARGADGLRRDARPSRRHAAPGSARRHPRAPRRARGRRRPRHARDRAIDLVCVNLYPFEQTVGRLDVEWDEAIEKIDVGGPALLRGAAKNHAHVIPVCRPDDYELVLARAADAATSRSRPAGRSPPAPSPARRRTTAPSRAGSRGARFPGDARADVRSRAGAVLRREPASAARSSTPSAAPARTCSRASSSSTASRSRSTTSTTSPPRACSRSSSTGRPA